MISLAEELSSAEIETIKGALHAAVEGGFFPDWEFETLIGVPRGTVRDVYSHWPKCHVHRDEFSCAVIGSLNNLLGYPHGRNEELVAYVPGGREAIRQALTRVRALGL